MPNSAGAFTTIRRLLTAAALIAAIGILGVTVLSSVGRAQTQANAAPAAAAFSNEELDELVGPIALYPDELLAITLPASTYPLEIVQAQRYLEKHKSEPELKPGERWDSSVLGLLNYPEVVDMMNQDLDWTSKLGDAVVNQQQDVNAIVASGDDLYVAVSTSGVIRYDLATGVEVQNWDTSAGIASDDVTSLALYAGVVYAGSSGGIDVYSLSVGDQAYGRQSWRHLE